MAAALAAAVLLALYHAQAGVWIAWPRWLSSFSWEPASRPFSWGAFLELHLGIDASLAAGLAWLAAASAFGSSLAKTLGFQALGARRVLVSIGLGLGFLSLAGFFLCLGGLLTRPAVWTLFIAVAAAGAAGFRSWTVPARPRGLDGASAAVLALAACAALFHFLGAVTPPLSFDETCHQLALPKLYALNRGFVDTPFHHFSFMPRNWNMLFSLGLVSGGAPAAKLLSFAAGLLAAAALWAFPAPDFSPRARRLAAGIFLLIPVVGNQLRLAASDLGTAFFELLAVFLLMAHVLRRERTLLLSGIFWGLALGSKYTALPGFAAAFLMLAWHAWRSRRAPREALKDAATLALPALALWAPWLIKNWLATGNPVAPLLSAVLTSRNFFFAGEYRPLVDYTVGLGISNDFPINGWRDLLSLPWALFTRHNDFNHDLGPVLLMALPLLAFRPRLRGLGPWFMLAALYWAGWLLGSARMSRYFVTGLGISSLLAGFLLDQALAQGPRWRKGLVLAPFLLALFQQAQRMVFIQNEVKLPWGYLAGRIDPERYVAALQEHSPMPAYAFANSSLPADARLLVVNEFRTFYLDRNFLASTPWDHDYWHELLRTSTSPADLENRLRALGVTHILGSRFYAASGAGTERVRTWEWTADDKAKERIYLGRHARMVYQDGEAWIVEVGPGRKS